ncbi:MAG: hypothetical protein IT181_00675 [Acidobacteria bacterium]|nr:hypothetical protein [Acidobacteriota bacterium]
MSDQWNDPGLVRAFQGLAETRAGECSEADAALVWDAVHGTLDAAARRELVARLATDPALAEAWRLAHAFDVPATAGAAPLRARGWRAAPWLAAAAVAVLGLTATLLVPRQAGDGATTRAGGAETVESLLATDAVLTRDAFVLRWRPGPDVARYHVRVTTIDVRPVAAARDLDRAEYHVPAAALANLAAGAQLLWQVEVTLPAGGRAVSETFVTRIQ